MDLANCVAVGPEEEEEIRAEKAIGLKCLCLVSDLSRAVQPLPSMASLPLLGRHGRPRNAGNIPGALELDICRLPDQSTATHRARLGSRRGGFPALARTVIPNCSAQLPVHGWPSRARRRRDEIGRCQDIELHLSGYSVPEACPKQWT